MYININVNNNNNNNVNITSSPAVSPTAVKWITRMMTPGSMLRLKLGAAVSSETL
jgi:hypothetical protein